jgi:hypothetical protein
VHAASQTREENERFTNIISGEPAARADGKSTDQRHHVVQINLQLGLARDLNVQPRTVKGWFNAKPLPDLREKLTDLCRLAAADNPDMGKLALKLEKLGPPER